MKKEEVPASVFCLLNSSFRLFHSSSFILLPFPSVVTAKCEPSVKDAKPELRYQFERLAYFCLDCATDCQLTTDNCKLIFNRTITLKDTWAKGEEKRSRSACQFTGLSVNASGNGG